MPRKSPPVPQENDEPDEPSSLDIAVVREVYDGNGAQERFALDLERYLESGISTIVIEPPALGDETARWITVGNFLHKTAVLSGLGAILATWASPNRLYIWSSLGALSLTSTALYTASWRFDPCCQYQVELNSSRLAHLMLESNFSSSSPIVLVRRDDSRRKLLHSVISLMAGALCFFRSYQTFK